MYRKCFTVRGILSINEADWCHAAIQFSYVALCLCKMLTDAQCTVLFHDSVVRFVMSTFDLGAVHGLRQA